MGSSADDTMEEEFLDDDDDDAQNAVEFDPQELRDSSYPEPDPQNFPEDEEYGSPVADTTAGTSAVDITGKRTPPDLHVFFFKATFLRKLFKNQLKPSEFCTKNVYGDSLQDVLRHVWDTVKAQINRKVVFEDNIPQWADEARPTYNDLEDYITFQDQTSRRSYPVSGVTTRVMKTWRERRIKIFVHLYSLNVESKEQHSDLVKKLIAPQNPDRAGAHSTRDDAALAEELRKTHPDLEAFHNSWLLWANFIHSAPAHEHEQMKMAESPPLVLAKYFRWVGVSEAARLQAVHRGTIVANVVNDGWAREAEEIHKDLDKAIRLLQSISVRCVAMKARGAAGSEWFSAMEAALQPEENDLSKELASQVSDCLDTDHI